MRDSSPAEAGDTAHSFESAGKPIAVDWHRTARPGPRPAVLMLHGRDGPHRVAEAYRYAAQSLAAQGYHVLFVRYFDSTDGDASVFGAAGLSNFFAWTRAITDAVTWAASREAIDPGRIGLLGVSLGASIALAQASGDLRVKAVVDFYGALPAPALALLRRMPPTLILHGAQDWVIPVAAAYQLEHFLRAHGAAYDMHIYPDQGHGFQGAAGADAVQRAAAFFDRHLHRS